MKTITKISICLLLLAFAKTSFCQKKPGNDKAERLKTIVEANATELGFNGVVLVGLGDDIFYQSAHGMANFEYGIANSMNTKFRLASLSKQFTAAALVILEQQGKVDFQQPLSTYLQFLKPEIADRITLHHVLSHSSGLGRDIESLSTDDFGHDYISLDEIIDLINTSDLLFEPGAKWSYSNLGYALAAAVIESVTGQRYGEAMDALIFNPLKMTNTGHETVAPLMTNRAKGYVDLPDGIINATYEDKSYVIGAGSIYSTARDLFIWSRELQKGTLISEANRKRMFTRHAGRYGYGWYVDEYVWNPVNGDNKAPNPHHDGGSPGFETKFSLLTAHDMVVIILSNKLPTPLSRMSNSITNTCMGFDERPPVANGKKQLFNALFEKGVEGAMAQLGEWRSNNQRHMLPGRFDVFLIGRGYLESNQYAKADLIMDFLIKVSPKWSYPYLFKAISLEEQRKIEEARALYEKVLEVNPEDSYALNRLKQLK